MTTVTPPKRRRKLNVGKLISSAFETFVLVEILWYYLSDGNQTFHGAIGEWLDTFATRVNFYADVARTRTMIRKLPET